MSSLPRPTRSGSQKPSRLRASAALAAPAPVSSDLTRAAAGELVSDATAQDARDTQMSLKLFPPASNKNLETAGIKRPRVRSDLDDDALDRHVAADNLRYYADSPLLDAGPFLARESSRPLERLRRRLESC